MAPRALRFGLVGLGRWGRNICRTVSHLKNVELAAVCSGKPDAASLVPCGCDVVRNWQTLIAPGNLDGLLLAVPPAVQAEIALAAIDRHLPVFLEKPLATDVDTAERIYRASVQARCPVLVDHIYTFHPGFRKLAQLTRTIGPVRSLRSRGGNHGPFRTDVSPLWDWAPHDVSMCLAIMGAQPVDIEATISQASGGTAANYAVRMTFQGGVAASLEFGNAMAERVRQVSVGTPEGDLEFTDTGSWIVHRDSGGEEHHHPYRRQRALGVAIRSFADNIRNGFSGTRQLKRSVDVVATIARIEALTSD